MRIAWIIGGLALAAVLGVAVIVEDGVPTPTAGEARATFGSTDSVPPGLRGAGPQPASAADASDGEAPTAARVQGWIGAAARVTAGSPEWDRLRRLLDVRFADFGPHMTLILEACLADAAERRAAGAALLAIALDARRLHGRLGPPRPPAIPRPSPLSPDHFDLALEIATSDRAQEAAAAIFANLKELGPHAHTLTPHAMAWCTTERSRYDEYVERMKFLGVTPDAFPYRGLDIARAIGQLGAMAIPYLDAWVTDEERLAWTAIVWIGPAAEPALLAWMRSTDAPLIRGALRLASRDNFRWSESVLQAVRAATEARDAGVRSEAAKTLTTWYSHPQVDAELARALRRSESSVRVAILEVLAKRINLYDMSERLREAVLAILRSPRKAEDKPVLAFMDDQKDLRPVDLSHVAPGLVLALARSTILDEKMYAWASPAEWWSNLDRRSWPHLWSALLSEDQRLREAAAWLMAWSGEPDIEHRRLLGEWLEENPGSSLRTNIAAALADVREPGAVQILLTALRAGNWSERGIAALGMGRLRAEGVAHLAALAAAISDAQTHPLLGDESGGGPQRLPRILIPNAAGRVEEVFRRLAEYDLEAAYDLSGHEAHDVRKLVRWVLLRRKDRSLPLLARRWAKATQAQRVATLVTIAQTHDRSVLTREFRAAFNSEDPAMRLASAGLIFTDPRTTADTARASDVLAEAAVLLSDSLAIRAETALLVAVAYKRQAMAVASLQRYRTHEDPAIRERALRIIHGVEHPPEALQPRVIR